MKIGDHVTATCPFYKKRVDRRVKIIGYSFDNKNVCCVRFRNGGYALIHKDWLREDGSK